MSDRLVPLPTGLLTLRIWRAGVQVEYSEQRNLVVAASKPILAHLLAGDVTNNSIAQIGFGSTITAAAPGNTGLSIDAYTKNLDAITYPVVGKVAFDFSLGAFEANGQVIAEFGLLTGSGALFARLVRAAPLTKDLSVTLSATWTLTF